MDEHIQLNILVKSLDLYLRHYSGCLHTDTIRLACYQHNDLVDESVITEPALALFERTLIAQSKFNTPAVNRFVGNYKIPRSAIRSSMSGPTHQRKLKLKRCYSQMA